MDKKEYLKVLEVIANDPDEYLRKKLADMVGLPESILLKLCKDTCVDVRTIVAWRDDCTEEMLDILSKDDYPCVRANVAKKVISDAVGEVSEIRREIAERLVNDPAIQVRYSLASYADGYPEILENLVNDDGEIRKLLVTLPFCSYEILVYLTKDVDTKVRRLCAERRDYKGLLDILKTDKNSEVRTAVAYNPICPARILELLAHDNCIEVKTAVVSTLKKRMEGRYYDDPV